MHRRTILKNSHWWQPSPGHYQHLFRLEDTGSSGFILIGPTFGLITASIEPILKEEVFAPFGAHFSRTAEFGSFKSIIES
jgi:hypothetical protein